ncbi:U-box domain-containing protein 2 [Zostera marina]|uniref:RING-type E3 ubiquitin transferase n=1 Tax=Zostera marina TaxID=29655 RepID=A0A0K9P322_ZOSMR|nr:U-box domain-containing protein 2 [Zostera marina]
MEDSPVCLNALTKSITLFGILSSKSIAKSELVQRYCQEIDEMLRFFQPILDQVSSGNVYLNEQAIKMLEEVTTFIMEAVGLVEDCEPIMSNIYFVLQIESLITKIQGSILETCSIFSSLFLSHEYNSCLESLKQCVQKIQNISLIQASKSIQEAIQDQIENKVPISQQQISNIKTSLNLSTIQKLLMEVVTLDKLKSNVQREDKQKGEVDYIDHMLTLIVHLHDLHVEKYQVHTINGMEIPADFCCPLSLKLMSDPVILSSGQTYERGFIRRWLDQGIMVCPKTRQTLSHANLIPNYTVKQLIENWCDTNNINLPSSSESAEDHDTTHDSLDSPESQTAVSTHMDLQPANGFHEVDSNLVGESCELFGNHESAEADVQSAPCSNGSDVGVSEKVKRGDSFPYAVLHLPGQPDIRPKSHTRWRHDSNRFSPQILDDSSSSSSSVFLLKTQKDDEKSKLLSDTEIKVNRLIMDLKTDNVDLQRNATVQLRLLTKHSMEDRILIANCGAIDGLIPLLHSLDLETQGNAVTVLLNLSINENNKNKIVDANSIDPLIHVLKTGNTEAKENAAATLFSLSVIEENKIKIGRSGAIGPLVDLLKNGTPRGKKDATTALFNLSIFPENKSRIVKEGAVKHLVELMNPAVGMVDRAVVVLANLATISDGRSDIGREGGIAILVEVVELGTPRGKEHAAAALLQLCTNSSNFCGIALREGVVPPLVALSNNGTSRAKEKAHALLRYFRNQRLGNSGRTQ